MVLPWQIKKSEAGRGAKEDARNTVMRGKLRLVGRAVLPAVACFFVFLTATETSEARLFDEARVAASFLKIGTGARACALGEAFSAIADDSTAVFWNPAGLGQVKKVEIQLMHNQWLQDFRHEYLGISFPGEGTWAVGYSLVDLGSFDEIDEMGQDVYRTFSVNDQVLAVGYGRAFLADTLFLGASAKAIKEDIGTGASSKALSMDLGVLAVPWTSLPGVSVAAVVQNIGGKISGFELPLGVRLGAAWRKAGVLSGGEESVLAAESRSGWKSFGREDELWQGLRSFKDSIIVSSEVLVPKEGRVEIHGGLEYWMYSAALRAGYRYRFPRNELGGLSGLTMGLGLRGSGFQFDYGFDYAYAPYGDLGDASRFSLLVSF